MVALLGVAADPAKPAPLDLEGKMFCFGSNRQLSETPAGYVLTFHMKMAGDLSKAQWFGGKPLIGPSESFNPVLYTSYKIDIGKDGKPTGRPKPFAISASGGRFSAAVPGPIDSLRMKIMAGATETPEMPLAAVSYSVAVPAGKITTPETRDEESNVVVPAAKLGQLVRAVEANDRTLLMLQNGAELGRIPFPKLPLRAQTEEVLAWASTTAQAMTARKTCS
jgi:hypothetical protein